MFHFVGRFIAISLGLAAVHFPTQTILAQNRAPVYIMGLSEIEPGVAAVLCKNDLIALEDLRRPDVINRIALKKFVASSDAHLRNEDLFVRPRASGAGKSGALAAAIEVEYTGFSSEAQAAFQYAAEIWSMLVETPVPIRIDASWVPLGPGVLGSAGPGYVFSDFGAGEADTWYVPALANALSGEDQDRESIDIVANFSSSFSSWYFGLDGNTPPGKIDFVTVVLHEIGHGLGFMGSMTVEDGSGRCPGVAGDGCWGFDEYPGVPIIYDRFAENATGTALIDESTFANPSLILASELQGGAVFFNGPASASGNGGTPPRLYAPAVWDAGSSYSHFDESTFSGINPNALMTPFLSASSALHDVGPAGCGLFADIGWNVTAGCGLELVPERPTVTPAPPSAGVLVSPVEGATGVPTDVKLEWETIAEADSYHLQMDTLPAFPSPAPEIADLKSNNYEARDLKHETQYFWRVRGVNRGGSGAWSPVSSFTTIVSPPGAPELQFPTDDMLVAATTISLSWSSVDRARSYSVQVATDRLFQNLIINQEDLETTALAVAGLSHDQEHFWRVRGKSAGGSGVWSQIFSFTTIVAAPSTPTLLSPENQAENVPVRAILDWNDVPRAASYDVQVSQSNKFSELVVDTSGVAGSGLEVAPLNFKEIYFWRARAVNAGGSSEWTAGRTFITQTDSPAEQPDLVSPFSGAGGLDLTMKLDWNSVSSAAQYDVQVSVNALFSEPLQVDTSITTAGLTIVDLAYDTRYFWRVRAVNAGGVGPWADAFHFNTRMAPPVSAPVLVSPANEAAGVAPDLLVVWQSVPGADEYDLQVSVDSTFSRDVLTKARLDSTSYPLYRLRYDSTYHWRARARNSGGVGAWSVVRRFNVESEPSGVELERPAGIPGVFALRPNYPNPFNPQTHIQFELARREHVRMSIFDPGGRLVEVLVDRSMPAGGFQVEWNASGLPSGVYMCRLEAGGFRGHIPLVLLR